MKSFIIFACIMGFFALVFVVSLFFPHQYRIEKSVIIEKSIDQTFNYLNRIENWKDWTPWNKSLDSTMEKFYSQIKYGKGATEYFRGGLVGIGRFRILESIPQQKLRYDLSINEGLMHSEAVFYFKQQSVNTQLSWVDSGDVGYNPLFRFLLPSKVHSTGESFDEGLRAIKRAAETKL